MSNTNKVANSKIHQQFQELVGKWKGTVKTYFKPDDLVDTSDLEGEITSVVKDHFFLFTYSSVLMGQEHSGIMIFGYNLKKNRYEAAWVDNFHTATEIMFSSSQHSDHYLNALGHYGDQEGKLWGWETQIQLEGDGLVITFYNIPPGGEKYIGVQAKLRRT